MLTIFRQGLKPSAENENNTECKPRRSGRNSNIKTVETVHAPSLHIKTICYITRPGRPSEQRDDRHVRHELRLQYKNNTSLL